MIAITDLMRQRDNPDEHNILLQCMFGTQGYVGDFHLSGFTETWMRDALIKTGFDIVYFKRKDEWLMEILARKIRRSPPDPLVVDGTNAEFVESAYKQILHRDLDDEGRAYWMQQLSDGIAREYVVCHLKEVKQKMIWR